MNSKTKYILDKAQVDSIFAYADLGEVEDFFPMSDGEYNSVYDVKTGKGEFVLKVAPCVKKSVLTYEKDMLRSELRWYRRIAENTKIRIPQILFQDLDRQIVDAEYYIMEKLNIVQSDISFVDKAEALADMAAQMHNVKGDKFGYEQNGLFDDCT